MGTRPPGGIILDPSVGYGGRDRSRGIPSAWIGSAGGPRGPSPSRPPLHSGTCSRRRHFSKVNTSGLAGGGRDVRAARARGPLPGWPRPQRPRRAPRGPGWVRRGSRTSPGASPGM